MSYQILAGLIEKHKEELARRVIPPAIELKVIDDTQIEVDVAGFMHSFGIIARAIGEENPLIWREFVDQTAQTQYLRGVSYQQGIEMGDYMFKAIDDLIDHKLSGAENLVQRDRFHRRLASMHSLGKITEVVSQMKAQGLKG